MPLILLTACGNSSGGLGGKSADQVLSIAVTAAREVGSFHFVDKNGSGANTRLLVGDTGTIEAQQSLKAGSGALDVRLVMAVVYIRAPSQTLESVLGLSATEASVESGKWLSVTSDSKSYNEIVKTLTPDAELDSYIPQAPLVVGTSTTLHGIPVVPVTGTAPAAAATGALHATATLFVSSWAPYRPVGGVLTGTDVHGRPQHDDVAFTRWGERVKVAVPAGAVPMKSLTP